MKSVDERSVLKNGRDELGRWLPGHTPEGARPFRPGQVGNPTGKPKGVTYPGNWIRGLMDRTRAELQAIVDDPACVASKVIAARQVLDAMDSNDPRLRGAAAERVLDRTEGRPTQYVETKETDTRSVEEQYNDLMAEVRAVVGDPDDKGPHAKEESDD